MRLSLLERGPERAGEKLEARKLNKPPAWKPLERIKLHLRPLLGVLLRKTRDTYWLLHGHISAHTYGKLVPD